MITDNAANANVQILEESVMFTETPIKVRLRNHLLYLLLYIIIGFLRNASGGKIISRIERAIFS